MKRRHKIWIAAAVVVAACCGGARRGQHAFAVDIGRESRSHPDLRHGASVRGAIDFVDLLAGYEPAELDLATLRFLGCSAYAGKLRVKPAARKTACQVVHELIDRFAIAGPAEYCAERLRQIADLDIARIYIGTRAVGVDLAERNAERIGREVLPLVRG